jgi:hypothetical protein
MCWFDVGIVFGALMSVVTWTYALDVLMYCGLGTGLGSCASSPWLGAWL